MHGGVPPPRTPPRPETDGGTSASALGLPWGRGGAPSAPSPRRQPLALRAFL